MSDGLGGGGLVPQLKFLENISAQQVDWRSSDVTCSQMLHRVLVCYWEQRWSFLLPTCIKTCVLCVFFVCSLCVSIHYQHNVAESFLSLKGGCVDSFMFPTVLLRRYFNGNRQCPRQLVRPRREPAKSSEGSRVQPPCCTCHPYHSTPLLPDNNTLLAVSLKLGDFDRE